MKIYDQVVIPLMHNFENVGESFKCWVGHKTFKLYVSIGSWLSTFMSSHIS